MQSRISFIGPLIGFAAAQQAAKANGLNPITSLAFYRELLLTDRRYFPESGRRAGNIFMATAGGCLISPWSARSTTTAWRSTPTPGSPERRRSRRPPSVTSSLRGNFSPCRRDRRGGIRRRRATGCGAIYHFVKWKDEQFRGKWWEIDYSFAKFPGESEIFTLGLQYGLRNGNSMEHHRIRLHGQPSDTGEASARRNDPSRRPSPGLGNCRRAVQLVAAMPMTGIRNISGEGTAVMNRIISTTGSAAPRCAVRSGRSTSTKDPPPTPKARSKSAPPPGSA